MSTDAEALLADCLLAPSAALKQEEQLVSAFAKKRGPLLETDSSSEVSRVLLPVVLDRICNCVEIEHALKVTRSVKAAVSGFSSSQPWLDVMERLETLARIPDLDEGVSVTAACNGEFSLFAVIAKLKNNDPDGSHVQRTLEAAFPEHFKLNRVISAHQCYDLWERWTAEIQVAKDLALPATPLRGGSFAPVDDENDEENLNDGKSRDEEFEEDPSLLDTEQSRLLVAAAAMVSADPSLTALYAWTHFIGPLFWKTASLVELARKTPSENVVRKMLSFSNMAELRQFCGVARDVLHVMVDAWEQNQSLLNVDFSALPFPSHPTCAFVEGRELWSQRSALLLSEFQSTLFLARSLYMILKFGLRSVVVSCVLPEDSVLRDRLQSERPKAGSRFNSVTFQRRELIMKLLPANNKLAISYARTLNVDLDSVRKMLLAQQTAL